MPQHVPGTGAAADRQHAVNGYVICHGASVEWQLHTWSGFGVVVSLVCFCLTSCINIPCTPERLALILYTSRERRLMVYSRDAMCVGWW
jgi:hypothetical protein